MIAVRAEAHENGGRLVFDEVPVPAPGHDELLIDVVGAGVNRADVLQRSGRYRLPVGASPVLGLEASGIVASVGSRVPRTWLGAPVVALVASGAYANQLVVNVHNVLPAPAGVGLLEAGGVTEVAATAVSNLLGEGRFVAGETVLIHGATGGVGSFAIQLIAALGGRVAVTASSAEKLDAARRLGADILIDYTTEDFAERMRAMGGADLILDTVGGRYLAANLDALATHGRIVTIGLQGGRSAELDFDLLLRKKASITGTLLRDLPIEEKRAILADVQRVVWPLLESGRITVPIDDIVPLAQAERAHDRLIAGAHLGKIVLDCRPTAEAAPKESQP